MSCENLLIKIFFSHPIVAFKIIFLWASSLNFHVAWQGNFEQ
ncbi:MAG: hypothetical protein AAFY63_24480, partial [Cyanobacteria bacterium J06643_13]